MAKILLVEDDNNLREIYGARLIAEGHQIVSAKDGEEALAISVKEKPDLVIADIMMPKISGFDMLDILRNAPETKNAKVIMLTALSQPEDEARANKLGADRYLVKSQVTLEDVVKVVRDVLAGTKNAGLTAGPAAAPTVGSAVKQPQANTEVVPAEEPTGAVPIADSAPYGATTETAMPLPGTAPSETPQPETMSPPEATATSPEETISSSEQPAAQPEAPKSTSIPVMQPEPEDSVTNLDVEPGYSASAPEMPAPSAVEEPVIDTPPAANAGTDLAQPASEEEKVVAGQIDDFENKLDSTPSGTPYTPTIITPTQALSPSDANDTQEEAAELPAPPLTAVEPPRSPLDDSSQTRKVIEPINNPLEKPDLDALVAAEAEKEGKQTSAGASPNQPANQSAPLLDSNNAPSNPAV